jgi:galactokinase
VILAGEGYTIPGFSLSIWGDVPLGSGLSSSAALEVATMTALTALMGVEIPGPKLARLCQRVENEFVGANCGIMDQFISANGKANHALLLDCRDLSFRLAPIPANVALVIANTMVNESLMRARHVISEDLRTVAASEALLKGDMKELGRLMAEAHTSYSGDFAGSCVEADLMVELANQIPGLIGARLTGGGFGGCTINLVEQEQAEAFAKELSSRYAAKTGIVPEIHVCHASDGAHRL